MSLYSPLEEFLKGSTFEELPITFSEISKILGRELPQSAYRHRPWWANEATGHSHAKAWLNAGFETAQVDMAGRKLVFRRAAPARASSKVGGLSEWSRDFRPKVPLAATLFGALKGTFTIEAGTIEAGWNPATPALEEELDTDRTADLIDSGLRGQS